MGTKIRALVDVLLGFVLLALAWVLTDFTPMLNRYVVLNQGGLDHAIPVDEPRWVMVVFVWLLPIVYLSIVHLAFFKSASKWFLVVIGWFTTMALCVFFTSFIRYFLPTPRPYYNTKCNSRVATAGYMLDTSLCSQPMNRHDMQSFPSGHTTLVWSSWVFALSIAVTLSSALRHQGGFYKLFFFFLIPLLVPLWMSCDRIRTGEHYAADVLLGGLIGITVAIIGFRNVDRNLTHPPAPAPLIA